MHVQLRGYIDLSTLYADIDAHIEFPFMPAFKLGEFKGNLMDGVTIKFVIPVIDGTITLFVKEGWLWIKFKIVIFGKTFEAEFNVIPLP